MAWQNADLSHRRVDYYAIDYATAEALILEGSLAGCMDLPKLRLRELYKSGSTSFVHLKDSTICRLTISQHTRPSRRELKHYKNNHPIDPANSHSPCQQNTAPDLVTDPKRDS